MRSETMRSARMRFLTTEEGGRRTAPASGVRSQLEVGEFQTSCVVTSRAGLMVFPLGDEVEVDIRPLFPERIGDLFEALVVVDLYEGSRLVATGLFTDEE